MTESEAQAVRRELVAFKHEWEEHHRSVAEALAAREKAEQQDAEKERRLQTWRLIGLAVTVVVFVLPGLWYVSTGAKDGKHAVVAVAELAEQTRETDAILSELSRSNAQDIVGLKATTQVLATSSERIARVETVVSALAETQRDQRADMAQVQRALAEISGMLRQMTQRDARLSPTRATAEAAN